MKYDRLSRARMGLILDAPFFGTLLMRMPMVRDDKVQTFCTNGREIRYSQPYLDELNDDEVKGVLVHEVLHVAMGHLWRMDQRNPKLWNKATDYAVNDILDQYARECSEQGRPVPWRLREDWLLDPKYKGMSSEEIYARLSQEKEEGGGGGGGGGGKGGDDDDGPTSPGEFEAPKDTKEGAKDGEVPARELPGDWEISVTQAQTAAKMQGMCPGAVGRLVKELVAPKVSWQEVLREFVRRASRDDYAWTKPNRRYTGAGFILPSLFSERMGKIAVAVDTSGSIDQGLLAEFQSEVQATLDECLPEAIEVIVCDAAVHAIQNFEPGDTVEIAAKGGGGTDFRPVFTHLENPEAEEPVCLVFFTDLMGSFPEKEPDYPVLWAAYRSGSIVPPFGEKVEVV